jgi:hypothetical protein
MNSKNLMYRALRAQCEAEIAESEFTLNNYMFNSVGIGEHPQQVNESMIALEKLASGKDKLDNLDKFFERICLGEK